METEDGVVECEQIDSGTAHCCLGCLRMASRLAGCHPISLVSVVAAVDLMRMLETRMNLGWNFELAALQLLEMLLLLRMLFEHLLE